jgi:CMP/dCMP kinase
VPNSVTPEGVYSVVTIDGPAGAGKSTAAKALANRLGFDFLDTGAMYRAVALAAIRAGVDLDDESSLAALVAGVRLEMPPGRVVLDGEDVTAHIRTPEVSTGASKVAVSAAVRTRLVELQRRIATGRNMVCEGRDQGTVVFPDAARKFFLVADPVERARRRQRQLASAGTVVELEELVRTQQERDRRDAARDLAPMVPAADALVLDTTTLTLDDVVARLEQEVRSCRGG